MSWISFGLPLLGICCLVFGILADDTMRQSEINSHTVSLNFYMLSINEWPNKEADFKKELVDQANQFCKSNPGTCGLSTGSTLMFSESGYNGTASNNQGSTQVQLYLMYPGVCSVNNSLLSNPTVTSCLLNKDAMKEIVKLARPSVNAKVGYWINFIDDEQTGPPPNAAVNNVVIPVACVITVFIFILAIVLYYAQKNRNKKEKRRKREEARVNRKRGNLVGPEPQVQVGADGNWNGSAGGTEQWFISESENPNDPHSVKAPPPYHTVEVPDDTKRYGGLPPLEDDSEFGDKKRKDKKRKKHKKHRKHGKDDENNHNSASEAPSDPEAQKQDLEKRKLINEQVPMSALSSGPQAGQEYQGDAVIIAPPSASDEDIEEGYRMRRAGLM